MYIESGENAGICPRRSFCRHVKWYSRIEMWPSFKEGHISILHTDGLGLSPNKLMAIVQFAKLTTSGWEVILTVLAPVGELQTVIDTDYRRAW